LKNGQRNIILHVEKIKRTKPRKKDLDRPNKGTTVKRIKK